MPGIVAEPAERHGATDRLRLGRDHGANPAPFEPAVDLAVGVAGVRRDGQDPVAGQRSDRVNLAFQHLAFVYFAGGDRDVEHDTILIVDRGVLLERGLEPPVAPGGRHCRVGIGGADLLVLSGLARVSCRLLVVRVGRRHCLDVAGDQALPADVGADQRGIDVDDVGLRDPRLKAGAYRALEDPAEALGAPALANPGQARMVGQDLVQAITAEPADCEVDLGLAHQPPVVDEAEQETREHQPKGDLGIDARPSGRGVIQRCDFFVQPTEIEHPIDPDQDVVVRQQVTQ